MSDDDFMADSDQEEYDFEYEDDEDDQDGDVDIENKYYNAKQIKTETPEDAIQEFLGIPDLEPEKGEWGFKGLKQAIKLEFKLRRYLDAVKHYEQLLVYVKSAVTRNYSEKSINNMLDFVEKHAEDESANSCMEKFYSLTLNSFQGPNNERLWLKTSIKLARLWFGQRNYRQLSEKLKELHKACQKPDGSDDPSKGTMSLEIYALEIQMHSETRNNKRLKALYERALKVQSAVPHPRIMGVIRECGGKMHLSEENWTEAYSDFFESFKNYDEAGSLQRIQVLKYLVLTTMLMKSDVNPFDAQETQPYKNDHRIAAMTNLVDAYQRDDVNGYEKILQENKDLLKDPFIAENIDEVTRNMRTKAVFKMIAPYSVFSIDKVASQLQISDTEVQDILRYLVINGEINGKIDQRQGQFRVLHEMDSERQQALSDWTKAVGNLWSTAYSGEGYRTEDLTLFTGASLALEGVSGEPEGWLARGRGGEGSSGSRIPTDKGKKLRNILRRGGT